jgi:hypothetical protein
MVIRPGSIWEDNDSRRRNGELPPRRLVVRELGVQHRRSGPFAICDIRVFERGRWRDAGRWVRVRERRLAPPNYLPVGQ